jgi:hypothetical protein
MLGSGLARLRGKVVGRGKRFGDVLGRLALGVDAEQDLGDSDRL